MPTRGAPLSVVVVRMCYRSEIVRAPPELAEVSVELLQFAGIVDEIATQAVAAQRLLCRQGDRYY